MNAEAFHSQYKFVQCLSHCSDSWTFECDLQLSNLYA